ncbi:MAG: hypothetical protein Q8L48_17095 [Archangium sp.]|nr:hypothetical protein [Archangium sp.]
MSELSPTARGLLARAKAASSPTRDDQARVLASLAATLPSTGAGATAAAKLSTGAGASGFSQVSTVKLLIAFVTAAGTGAVGTSVLHRELSGPPPATARTRVVAARPAEVSPPPRAEPGPVARAEARPAGAAQAPPGTPGDTPAAAQPAPTPPLPAGDSRPAADPTSLAVAANVGLSPHAGRPPPTVDGLAPEAVAGPDSRESRAETSPVDPCDLSAELSTLRRAQVLLPAAPSDVVELLESWQRDCPRGELFEERLAVRALALCAQAKREAGRALLLELRTRFPSSPSIERVDRQCALP